MAARQERSWVALIVVLALAACGDGDHRARRAGPTATPAVATPTASPRPTVDPAPLAGVYDMGSESEQRELSATAVAVVRIGASGALELELYFDTSNYVQVSGDVLEDGSVVLEGSGIFDGDLSFEVLGTGELRIGEDGRRRIRGAVNGYPEPDGTIPTIYFSLDRPERPTVTPYAGRYRFEFARSPSGCGEPSHAALALAFEESGHGEVTAAANDQGTGDAVFGRIEPGPCLLSPTGRLRCQLVYRHGCQPFDQFDLPILSHAFTLSGQLFLGGGAVSGAGRVEVGLFNYGLGGQSWTARR